MLVAFNWFLIGAIFAGAATFSHWATFVVGAALLGGRHMGLAILMHEAGHNTLFRSSRLNHWVGQWLCAYPILSDMAGYAASHQVHHQLAGTADDPDLPNYRAYPVTRASFRRKVARDLTGRTGIRNLRALLRGGGGDIMSRGDNNRRALFCGLAVNAVLAAVLGAFGVLELYGMWVLGYLCFYPLIARIRQLAEHGNVIDGMSADPRANTRTIVANPLERLLLCPNGVNYHCEHHFLASVPAYRLRAFHQLLRSKGFYAESPRTLARGYADVLRVTVPAASA